MNSNFNDSFDESEFNDDLFELTPKKRKPKLPSSREQKTKKPKYTHLFDAQTLTAKNLGKNQLGGINSGINISYSIECASVGMLRKIREGIKSKCGWSTPTYYRKQQGERGVTRIESIAIAEIVELHVKEYFEIVDSLVSAARRIETENGQ